MPLLKPLFMTAVLGALAAAAVTPATAANLSIGVTLGDPNYYGTLELGDGPTPELLYPNAQLIVRGADSERLAPLYLRVPAEHAAHWRHYCRQYHACNRRVFFVRERWYQDVYAPRYHQRHEDQGRHDGHERREHEGER